ncbi:hypothetical protein [Clostridium sporogenes]|uniref:hypothetical protein n=1 Tax=Clostridium sporogenes TaxID=1509 RepID=UPI0013D6ACD5|nr:hypothetical protein [Clostridium sporogenes]
MHNLTVSSNDKNTKIKLDNFELQNVIGYEIKSSDNGTTELMIKILVNNSKIEI